MLPSDVQLMASPEGVEVRPDLISKTFSEVWAGLSGELLDRLRRYITTTRMGELSLAEQVMKAETRLSSLCSEGGDTKAPCHLRAGQGESQGGGTDQSLCLVVKGGRESGK